MRPTGEPFVYVGKDDDEIAIFRMDAIAGDLSLVGSVAAGRHPSFLAFTPDRKFAYAVNEFAGSVASFSVDPQTGRLSILNRESSLGTEPAYVSVDASGSWVLAANYRSGPVAVFPIA